MLTVCTTFTHNYPKVWTSFQPTNFQWLHIIKLLPASAWDNFCWTVLATFWHLHDVSLKCLYFSISKAIFESIQVASVWRKINEKKLNWKSLRFFTLLLIGLVFHLRKRVRASVLLLLHQQQLKHSCVFLFSMLPHFSRVYIVFPSGWTLIYEELGKSVRWTVKKTETEGKGKNVEQTNRN